MVTHSAVQIQIVPWGSQRYIQSLGLRFEVLRRPLGMVFDPAVFLDEVNDVHLVALQNDWVLGCMILSRAVDGVKMRQVAVDQREQRLGVGSEMIRFAEQYAKEMGYKAILLHARDSAVPFYLKHNYELVGDGLLEVGIPHHAMRKSFVD